VTPVSGIACVTNGKLPNFSLFLYLTPALSSQAQFLCTGTSLLGPLALWLRLKQFIELVLRTLDSLLTSACFLCFYHQAYFQVLHGVKG
jgi:hypothetical protein